MNNKEERKQGNTTSNETNIPLEERVISSMNDMLCSLMWLRHVLRKHRKNAYRVRYLRADELIKLA